MESSLAEDNNVIGCSHGIDLVLFTGICTVSRGKHFDSSHQACYREIKRRQSINWFIANLACSDLAFTVLSILNCIDFAWTWLGGTVTCKLQGFLLEACYNTSIITLAVISFERRRAVLTPFIARTSDPDGKYRKSIAIWIASFVIGSPLLVAYVVKVNKDGSLVCNNSSFGVLAKQVYYSLHTVFIFVVPLLYMIYAQSTIFFALISRVAPTENILIAASSLRLRKATRTLMALTMAFIICWAPFIVVRTLMYFHLMPVGYFWRGCQVLIVLNTVLDPLLYGICVRRR